MRLRPTLNFFRGPPLYIALDLRQAEVVHEKRETTVEAHILAKAASSLDACRYVRLGSLHDICCIPLTSFQLNKEPYSTQKN